jgi:hypothetical protein
MGHESEEEVRGDVREVLAEPRACGEHHERTHAVFGSSAPGGDPSAEEGEADGQVDRKRAHMAIVAPQGYPVNARRLGISSMRRGGVRPTFECVIHRSRGAPQ